MGLLSVTCIHRSRSAAVSYQFRVNTADEHSWRDKSCSRLRYPRSRQHPIPPACLTACVCCPDKPEILRADARYQQVEGAGLLLLLFVLVQANPPASITWVDQDGHVMANASEILLLGATRYPGLANHSLRIHLGSAASNFSVSAANSVGVTTASLLPPGRCWGVGAEQWTCGGVLRGPCCPCRSAGCPRGAAPPGCCRRSSAGPGCPAQPGLLCCLSGVPAGQAGARRGTSRREQPTQAVLPLQLLQAPAAPGCASAPPDPVPAPRPAPRRLCAGSQR